jgi:O-methyltransferase domain
MTSVQPIGTHLDELEDFHAYLLQAQNANAVLLAIGQLRLLDHLDAGPASAVEIAGKAGLEADRVYRVLRFLASQQVVDCDDENRFRHTARSRLLQKQQSGLKFMRESMGAAQGLAQCLQTGRPAFDLSFGMPVFQYLAEHPDTVRYFADLMSRTTAILEAFVFANHRFEPFELAVDVGGSQGRLMMALLSRYPGTRGIVFDLPETAAQASAIVAESPEAHRIEVRGGDFFDAVPAGGDLYLLKQILHDWGDEACVGILRSIRDAISERGRLAVIEYLLPDARVHHHGFAMDIHMMVLSTGKERTLPEYEALLEAAGFRLDRVTENPRGQSVAEAVPV